MISRASSRRRTGSPNSFVVTVPPLRLGRSPSVRPRRADGLLDVGVAGAAAEVAADHVVDLLLGELRRGVARLQAGGDRHQEARRAEPALQRVALAEGLLHRVQHLAAAVVVARQALDGGHLVPVDLDGEHQARAHRVAVDQHRARAADAVLAADVRAGQPEVVPQRVGQQPRAPARWLHVEHRSR